MGGVFMVSKEESSKVSMEVEEGEEIEEDVKEIDAKESIESDSVNSFEFISV